MSGTRGPLAVVTDCRHGRVDEELAVLTPLGVELRVADCRSPEDVAEACAEADAVLLDMAPMDAAAIASLRHCKVISRYGVGLDNVDLAAAAAAGIEVRNVPGYCDEEVASHALAMLLALARDLPARDRAVRAGGWNLPGRLLSVSGATVGVAGFGGTGRAFCRMALALKPARLAVWSPSLTEAGLRSELGSLAGLLGVRLEAVGFERLLEVSDFLSLHLRLTDGTRGLLGRDALSRCKPGAILVNASRGALVDEAALADALAGGRLGGAGLDTPPVEPPDPGSPLLCVPNLLLSDHCAYRSDRSISELKRRCAENAAAGLGLGA